jgi:hypothetical protein
MVTRWSTMATLQLKRAFEYIKRDSYQNAIQVRNDIVIISEVLPLNPGRFPPDKFKVNNDGTTVHLNYTGTVFLILY